MGALLLPAIYGCLFPETRTDKSYTVVRHIRHTVYHILLAASTSASNLKNLRPIVRCPVPRLTTAYPACAAILVQAIPGREAHALAQWKFRISRQAFRPTMHEIEAAAFGHTNLWNFTLLYRGRYRRIRFPLSCVLRYVRSLWLHSALYHWTDSWPRTSIAACCSPSQRLTWADTCCRHVHRESPVTR